MSRSGAPRVVFDTATCRGVVVDQPSIEALVEKWFGRRSEEGLILDLVEVSYLILEGRAVVETRRGVVLESLGSLMEEAPSCFKDFFWPQLLVYKDLRDRGRRVQILGQGRFLVRDKHGSLRIVRVLEEKREVSIQELMKEVEDARSNSLSLVLAIVSLQGDVTYYEAGKVSLEAG
ncbi:MAG: endonuclease [Desulfurococcus sp.]|nr:endonuclease [Desulfurococcus sp.]